MSPTHNVGWTWTLVLVTIYIIVSTAHILEEDDDDDDHEPNNNIHKPYGTVINCPEIPKFPEIPKCPEIPKFPEIPKCPEIPKFSEIKFPQCQKCSEIPKCPEIPTFPEIPKLPECPKLPEPPEWREMLPRSCQDVLSLDPRPVVTLSGGVKVMCDTQTDGGGWTIFQRRTSGDLDFYRNWDDYRNGFGDVDGAEFWLGNERLHQLTFWTPHELRVDFTFKGVNYSAVYSTFRVYGEGQNYKLEIFGYMGTAGDSMANHHNGMSFSTKDRDNDKTNSKNCAVKFHGCWWYKSCHYSNLNGRWGSAKYGEGLTWRTVTGEHDSATFTEMKIRPKS